MATPKSRAKDIASDLGLYIDEFVDMQGPRTAARVGMNVDIESLRDITRGVEDMTDSAFKGALVGVRFRDADGAWHTLVPLSSSPGEFLSAWNGGVARLGNEYGKTTAVTDLDIYVVEE